MRTEARKYAHPVRFAAVAGDFYPGNPALLRTMLEILLTEARGYADDAPAPKAIIVPHAGYVYSGPVAARAYARLARVGQHIRRVVLIGPAHRVGFYGIAVPDSLWFETPLGQVPVDQPAVERACALPTVFHFEAAHRPEHSLEVQLPFLQTVLHEDVVVVPLVVGNVTGGEVARVLDHLWGGPETLVLVSSDLSHHLDYEHARVVDEKTSSAIESLDDEAIEPGLACGRLPIQGLLRVARRRGLKARRLDLRSSGDTAGPCERVVGYGAFEFA